MTQHAGVWRPNVLRLAWELGMMLHVAVWLLDVKVRA
jgi:hypothetical protein